MEWAKFQERERKKEEEEKEKERVAYAQIDWHDFVVVETVDFQPNEQGTSARNDSKWERWESCSGSFQRSSRIPQRALSRSCPSLLGSSATPLLLNLLQPVCVVWALGIGVKSVAGL